MKPVCWEITAKGMEIWESTWSEVVQDFQTVIPSFPKVSKEHIAGPILPSGKRGEPVFKKFVLFNDQYWNGDNFSFPYAQEEESRVTKALEKKGRFTECCDTDGLPYEIAVLTLLLLAKERLGEEMRIGYGFSATELLKAKRAMERTLGRSVDLYEVLGHQVYLLEDSRGHRFYCEVMEPADASQVERLLSGKPRPMSLSWMLSRHGLLPPFKVLDEERLPVEELAKKESFLYFAEDKIPAMEFYR